MQSIPSLFTKLTVLIAFISFGSIAASAQSTQDRKSETPSPKQEPADLSAPVAPQLKPIAPPPSLVVDAAGMIPTEAQLLPPAPRLVKLTAGTVAVPEKGAPGGGDYRSTQAAISTPLQVNSGFGYRGRRMHTGIDFQASWGESVGASLEGTVAFAGIKHGYGNLVIVEHHDGISTYYAHLSAIYVGVGQTVHAAQVLGAVGSTGRSTGPHLHYEVRINGHPINPTATISLVNGEVFVNGQPFSEETAAPAAGDEPTSQLAEPDEAPTRARRVIQKRVLFYGANSLTAY